MCTYIHTSNINSVTNQIKARKKALRQLQKFKISYEHKPSLISF